MRQKLINLAQKGWVKTILLVLVVVVVGFGLLNFDYFAKYLGYYIDRGLVTDQQREMKLNEHPINLEPNQLSIPSLDIFAPIKFVEKANEAEFQKALIDGVVQYPNTAPVGAIGNTYIFGHSSDFAFSKGNYKSVFALLPNIEIGADILASNEVGDVYKYKVYEKFVAKKTDLYLIDQHTNGRTILTLQTSYPIGTALQRYIVKAELVEQVK